MLNLNDLHFFVSAVEHGGFAAAARHLGVPKSTVSKRVAELEERLEVRLIHRTSRSFALTELGRDFFEHARASVLESEAAQDVVRRRQAEPSGVVKITASVPVAQSYLAAQLPAFARRYPKLRLQVEVSDRMVDLVQEGIDIAIRSHFAPLPDSGLVQRQVAVDSIVLVAAPSYLAARDGLRTPEDLAQHDGLLVSAAATHWQLAHASGQTRRVASLPRMIANESTLLAGAAAEGLGIACLPEAMCREALSAGRLVRVLPEWIAGRVTTTLVLPHRRGQLPAVRATVEFLAECLREP